MRASLRGWAHWQAFRVCETMLIKFIRILRILRVGIHSAAVGPRPHPAHPAREWSCSQSLAANVRLISHVDSNHSFSPPTIRPWESPPLRDYAFILDCTRQIKPVRCIEAFVASCLFCKTKVIWMKTRDIDPCEPPDLSCLAWRWRHFFDQLPCRLLVCKPVFVRFWSPSSCPINLMQ